MFFENCILEAKLFCICNAICFADAQQAYFRNVIPEEHKYKKYPTTLYPVLNTNWHKTAEKLLLFGILHLRNTPKSPEGDLKATRLSSIFGGGKWGHP